MKKKYQVGKVLGVLYSLSTVIYVWQAASLQSLNQRYLILKWCVDFIRNTTYKIHTLAYKKLVCNILLNHNCFTIRYHFWRYFLELRLLVYIIPKY